MKLKGKVFIITGATSGMGKAIAHQFALEGAHLIINGRDLSRGKQVVEEMQSLPGNIVIFHPGDVSDPKLNQEMINLAIREFGKIDGIVCNAGRLGLGKVTDVSLEDWHRTMNTNFNAFFYLSKYALPTMLDNGGVIIANASIAANKSFPNHPAYCSSKAAMVALAKQMALDYGPKIRVNAICPGPVDTPMIWDSAKAFPDPEKAVANAAEATLLKRLGTPEDVARLALFLASDDSNWITGTAITIDGGILTAG